MNIARLSAICLPAALLALSAAAEPRYETGAIAAGQSGAAANNDGCHDRNESADCLVVMVDHLRPVRLEREAKTVLIGNPAVADVNMVSGDHAVITARTVGATNLIFLDAEGAIISDFEIVVREGENRRVVLRRGPKSTELYQCAPRCERTLTQLDSEPAHTALSTQIDREAKMNAEAAGGGVAPAQ